DDRHAAVRLHGARLDREPAPRAIAMAHAQVDVADESRRLDVLLKIRRRALAILGMHEVHRTPLIELLRRISEEPFGGRTVIGDEPVLIDDRDYVEAVLDDRAEVPFAAAQRVQRFLAIGDVMRQPANDWPVSLTAAQRVAVVPRALLAAARLQRHQ